MHVFVTGASGWIGSAVVDDLLAHDHHVTGLARSDASAAALEAKGADVRRGDLDDLAGLQAGATEADAVVHLANKHDWANPAASNAAERAAVEAIADSLVGSDKRFFLAAGAAGLASDRPALESDVSPAHGPDSARGGAENLALEYVDRGVHVVSVRFAPTVHGMRDPGFIAAIAQAARDKGVSGYVGDGANRWAAVHRSDAARLVRLGLGDAPAGSKLHTVAEEGVATRDIAEALGRSLGLPTAPIDPDDAADHFGWISRFFALDMPVSSAATQELLSWTPTGPGLVADIEDGAYR